MTADALEISGFCQSGRMGPCRMRSAPLWGVGRCWGTGQDLTGVPAQSVELPARPSCCWCGQSAQLTEVELAVDGTEGLSVGGPGEGQPVQRKAWKLAGGQEGVLIICPLATKMGILLALSTYGTVL